MRITILSKLLVLLFVLAVIPLGLLGYLAVNDIRSMGKEAMSNVRSIGDITVKDSTSALNALGEEMIKQIAVDVAKQLEIYIKDHPDMTVEDLQNDEYFSAMAVQPVGKTGYTAITDVDTLWCRWHVNPKVANSDLHNLATKLPGFWSVMVRTEGGKVSEGYYDWLEPDGVTIKQKYMYIAIVDARTADNVQFSVAATTYIEEFNAPVVQTKEKINSAVTSMVLSMEGSIQDMRTKTMGFVIAMLVVVAICGFMFAKSISHPIKELKKAADRATSGDFEARLPKVKGKDEVAELTGSMEMLITALKHKSEKKKK
ncbi:HAMP domain-containing protein [Candidatus Woesearchaeota archaeon]|nr:HAMP domain-containing protein [Candidatus Woesearchaeota archaeon]